jgi:hypothetical protein
MLFCRSNLEFGDIRNPSQIVRLDAFENEVSTFRRLIAAGHDAASLLTNQRDEKRFKPQHAAVPSCKSMGEYRQEDGKPIFKC